MKNQTPDTVVLSNILNVLKMPEPLEVMQEQVLQFAFILAKELGVKDVRSYLQTRLNERSLAGVKKYGTTLCGAELPTETLIAHALEEMLDAANYLEAALQTKK